jgi:hypothetical protein
MYPFHYESLLLATEMGGVAIAVAIGLIGIDPLQLALLASTVIALFLPISLSPFLILMNDPQ